MTVGIATKLGDEFYLFADSRTTSGTYKNRNTNKIHSLGNLSIICAGDVGQIQNVLRSAGVSDGSSVEAFIGHIEDCSANECEWIVCDGQDIYWLTPGENNTVAAEILDEDEYSVIGSGAFYVRGYLDAHKRPQNRKQLLALCKNALSSCSERFLCVGGPFRCRIVKNP